MNHVHSNALTKTLLPDIAMVQEGLFSTSVGLSWYHASIAPLPAGLFSTLTGLLAFIKLPCFKILLSIESLSSSMFSTSVGLPLIIILNVRKTIGTRAC